MPRRDGTGRLGRGKDCDEKAKADRMGRRPMDGRRQINRRGQNERKNKV